ncbi:recombinase RecT [Duodenibacillus massiliensis]|uniref:recombinase RecT n=1 Tax=Duodenibacillus massiliensis TaxID=1852381 RepID=UPI003079B6D0
MNEITIQNAQRGELLPAPKSTAEAMELAKTLASSQLIPKAFQQRPGDVFVAMMWSHSLGIPIVQGLQGIAVINGKPSLYGDALLAVCMGSGQMADIEETVTGNADNLTATCKVTRRGKPTPVVSTFSMADARAAGLLGKPGPWKQYTSRMLKMRARAFALRDAFPDVLSGIASAEEMQDVEGTATEKATENVAEQVAKMPRRRSKLPVQAPKEGTEAEVVKPAAPAQELPLPPEPEPAPAPAPEATAAEGEEIGLLAMEAKVNACENLRDLYAFFDTLSVAQKADESLKAVFVHRREEIQKAEATAQAAA